MRKAELTTSKKAVMTTLQQVTLQPTYVARAGRFQAPEDQHLARDGDCGRQVWGGGAIAQRVATGQTVRGFPPHGGARPERPGRQRINRKARRLWNVRQIESELSQQLDARAWPACARTF